MFKLIVHFISILGALLAFSEFIGKTRLQKFEKLVRQHITLKGFFLLPLRFFYSLLNHEKISENIVGYFCLSFVLIILVDQPFVKSTQEIAFNFYFVPIIAIGQFFDSLSDFLAQYSQIISILTLPIFVIIIILFTSLYSIYLPLALVTLVAVIALYPLLLFLSVGNWLKHRFKLTGSFIKIAAAVLTLMTTTLLVVID